MQEAINSHGDAIIMERAVCPNPSEIVLLCYPTFNHDEGEDAKTELSLFCSY